jgi:hypothetical protein
MIKEAAAPRRALRWGLQLSAKPCVRSEGLHRIDYFDHSLMDVIARRALKRLDVETCGTGRNPHQRGSCLAREAKWSDNDHDASPWSGGKVTELSVTGRYRGGR